MQIYTMNEPDGGDWTQMVDKVEYLFIKSVYSD